RHLSLPPARGPSLHPWLAARLLMATLATRPEVVHVFKPKGPSGLVTLGVWLARRLAARRLRLVQDSDDWEGAGGWNDAAGYPAWQRRLFAWQERWGLRHADAATLASEALVERAGALGARRTFLLPNGPPPVRAA